MQAVSVLITGVRVCDPGRGVDQTMDVRIEAGKIAQLGVTAAGPAERVLDGRGLVVAPGFVDAHVHLREPGEEHKETVATGTRAAARGGMVGVMCMPNTKPALDTRANVDFVGARPHHVKVWPVGAITRGREGRELTDQGELSEAGCVALSDDGACVASALVLRRAMQYATGFNLPIIEHCEDAALTAGAVMNEGLVSTTLGLRGMPWSAEAAIVARDVMLAAETGARLHVAHISTRQALEVVRRAKAEGLPVTCEATPHHLALTDEAVRSFSTSSKVNPPLREQADREALLAGVVDGTIDMISSDHAPHALEEKELDYQQAPFGISGVETSFAVAHTQLVASGLMGLPALIERMALAPRRVFNLGGAEVASGALADLVLFDPKATWTVQPTEFFSRGQNTPFAGSVLTGMIVMTVAAGQLVYEHPVLRDRGVQSPVSPESHARDHTV